MKTGVIFFIFIFALFLSPCHAEEELAPGFNACVENAPSTVDHIECIGKAYNYWDKILNANYKKAKEDCKDAAHPDTCSKDLLKAQRLWIQYRDAMSDVVLQLAGDGSISRLVANQFLAEETKKQANLLASPDN